MAITLTEKAAKKIQSQLAKNGGGLGLRLGIKKVGCNGFAYTFDYAAEALAGDQVFESHNPNAEGECGCGESFNLKKTSTTTP